MSWEPDAREGKLPIWAQARMRALRDRIKWAEEELDKGKQCKENEPHIGIGTDFRGLTTVKRVGINERISYQFTSKWNDVIEITTGDGFRTLTVRGHEPILVRPASANAVYIELTGWGRREPPEGDEDGK